MAETPRELSRLARPGEAGHECSAHAHRGVQGREGRGPARLLQVAQHAPQHLGVHLELLSELVLLDPLAPRQRVQRDRAQADEGRLRVRSGGEALVRTCKRAVLGQFPEHPSRGNHEQRCTERCADRCSVMTTAGVT